MRTGGARSAPTARTRTRSRRSASRPGCSTSDRFGGARPARAGRLGTAPLLALPPGHRPRRVARVLPGRLPLSPDPAPGLELLLPRLHARALREAVRRTGLLARVPEHRRDQRLGHRDLAAPRLPARLPDDRGVDARPRV